MFTCLFIYLFVCLFVYLFIYSLLIHCKPQLHAAYPVPCLIAQNILSSSMPSACFQPVTDQAQAKEMHVQLLCILIACVRPVTICCCFYDCFQKNCMQPQQQNCDPCEGCSHTGYKWADRCALVQGESGAGGCRRCCGEWRHHQ